MEEMTNCMLNVRLLYTVDIIHPLSNPAKNNHATAMFSNRTVATQHLGLSASMQHREADHGPSTYLAAIPH